MRLLNEVKILREEFPSIKIRQLQDELNRKSALFVLPDCAENMRLVFEHDCMILDFYGCGTVYGYDQREFRYMVEEIRNLLECRTLVVTAESGGKRLGSMIASSDELSDEFLISTVKRFCRIKGIIDPKSIFVNMYYCNTELDSAEYYSSLKRTTGL